jgi:exosome complex component RRP4
MKDKKEEVKEDKKTEKKIEKESKLLVENREVVVPGQILADGFDFLPSYGSYRKGEEIRAKRLGIINVEGKVLKIIPLSGKYLPKKHDVIIGKVIDITMNAWRFDINSAYSAMLNIREVGHQNHSYNSYPQKGSLSKLYDMGDYVFCKITNVSGQNLVDLTTNGHGLRRLYGGRILYVNTHKVPRIIGKKGSMVNMIKDATNSKLIVGQNGVVWLLAEPEMEAIAVKAIRKIEKESHISGLTDRVRKFLEKETGKKIENKREEKTSENKNNNQN